MTAFLAWLFAILKALPILDKWFVPTEAEKLVKKQEELDKQNEKESQTGRPKWD